MLIAKYYILSLWKQKQKNLFNKTSHFHWKAGGENCPAVPNGSSMQWKSLLLPSKSFCQKILYKSYSQWQRKQGFYF